VNRRRGRGAALAAGALLATAAALPAAPSARAPEPAPQLRSAFVAHGAGQAFLVIRLTGDLPRRGDGSVNASARVGGRPTGEVTALDLVSFRHYCFRARLRRPRPAVGRAVAITLRSPALLRPLHTVRIVVRARPGDATGARLGCRLPVG
jgi:hypothetical protein